MILLLQVNRFYMSTKMINKKISKSIIPNTATALNIASGFLSIIFVSKGDIHTGALLIFIAAFFDLIDGVLARLTKTTSMFGVELDSLADVVSFGAAPSFLIYNAYLVEYNTIGIVISSLILLFGSFRLARFNVQLEDIKIKLDFSGLPIPIAALSIVSLVLFFHNGSEIIKPFDLFVIPSVILVSLLMISTVKYNAIPKINTLGTIAKVALVLLALIALLLLILTNGAAIFYIIWFHILFGIFRYLYFKLFSNENHLEVKVNK